MWYVAQITKNINLRFDEGTVSQKTVQRLFKKTIKLAYCWLKYTESTLSESTNSYSDFRVFRVSSCDRFTTYCSKIYGLFIALILFRNVSPRDAFTHLKNIMKIMFIDYIILSKFIRQNPYDCLTLILKTGMRHDFL